MTPAPDPFAATPRRTAREVFARRAATALLVVVWISAAVATHLPAEKIPTMYTSDKTKHVVGYFGLATIFLLTLRAYRVRPRRRWLLALPILAAYGAVDELTQPWFNRFASVLDWACNLAGITLACLVDAALWWWLGRNTEYETSP
jgi:VanZ family protein